MILKIRKDTCAKGTWYFFDNIISTVLHYNRKPPDDWPIGENEIDILPSGLSEGDTVMIINLEFKDGREKMVRFVGEAYLLNDDGKTIERL